MDKTELRHWGKSKRRSLSKDQAFELSRRIQGRFLSLWPQIERQHKLSFSPEQRLLGLYEPIQNEVSTSIVQQHFENKNWKCLYPKIIDRNLEFFEVEATSQNLRSGQGPGVPRVLVVPGILFDLTGARLGFGGGFYDRYLSTLGERPIVRIALAFDFQLLEKIPTEPHDQPMDLIVTETRIVARGVPIYGGFAP